MKNVLLIKAVIILSLGMYSCEDLLFEEDISNDLVVITAPVSNAEIESGNINFSWFAVEGASNYHLQIAAPNFQNAQQVVLDTSVVNTNFNFALNEGNYEWRIRAENESSRTNYVTSSFSVISNDENQDISDNTLMLISPVNEETVESNPVVFEWQEIEGASDYHLQLASPNFNSSSSIVLDTITNQITLSIVLENNSYEWRVKGTNSEYETEFTTDSFFVDVPLMFAQREVILTSPEDNSITNDPEVNLEWEVVEEAELYRIQIRRDSDNELIEEVTTSNTNIDVVFPEGTFAWRVRAKTTSANTEYSQRLITIDSQAPNIPVLLTPEDADTLNSTQIDFSWDREPIEGSEEVDVIYIYSDIALSDLVLQDEIYGNSHTVTLQSGLTYYWRMQALDQAGNQSGFSIINSFTIDE